MLTPFSILAGPISSLLLDLGVEFYLLRARIDEYWVVVLWVAVDRRAASIEI
jgi:hypothetical protein